MPEQSVNFDRAADYYDATRAFPDHERDYLIQFIVNSANLKSTDTLLEIGIGTGRVALPLSSYVDKIFGADISSKMMRQLQSKKDVNRVYLAQADASQLPYPNNRFDAIMAVHVFHLVADLAGVLDEVARVLKPDAPLIQVWASWRDDNPLATAWNNATKFNKDVSLSRTSLPEQIRAKGWQSINEVYQYNYTKMQTPKELLYPIENRMWSSTWLMPDEVWEAGVKATKEALNIYSLNPEEPIENTAILNVELLLSANN